MASKVLKNKPYKIYNVKEYKRKFVQIGHSL